MTTISEILNGAEQDLIARAAEIALHGSSRYTKGRLTVPDFGRAIGTELGQIAETQLNQVVTDSLANLSGWRGSTAQVAWDDLQKLWGAAHETHRQPTLTRTLTLLEYNSSVVYESTVYVYVVAGLIRHRIITAKIGMKVTFSIAELSCTVQRGRLMRVHGRIAKTMVTLYLNDLIEVGRETGYTGNIDISLPLGIPLLPQPVQPQPALPVPPPVSTGRTPVPPITNTMAILSLIFAILFPPAGIIFGHMAQHKIRGNERGRGMATAGLVISYLLTGLLTMACCFGAILAGINAPTT